MPKYALLDKSGKTRLTTEAPNLEAALKSLQADRNGTPIPEGWWTIVKREVKPTKPKRPALLKKAEPKKAEPKKAEPKKLAPGHVTLRMDSGDTLEFWLELDSDGVLDLRGCATGDAVSFYVASILPSGVLERHSNLDLPGLQLNQDGEVMM